MNQLAQPADAERDESISDRVQDTAIIPSFDLSQSSYGSLVNSATPLGRDVNPFIDRGVPLGEFQASLNLETSSETATLPSPAPSSLESQMLRGRESEQRGRLQVSPPSLTEKHISNANRQQSTGLNPGTAALQTLPFLDPDVFEDSPFPPLLGPDHAPRPPREWPIDLPPLHIPDFNDDFPLPRVEDEEFRDSQFSLREEFERRWILNLSMHFRDKSNREKFFVTYAETPTRWRRITVSLEYRNAPRGSLEADLEHMRYQKDKSFRVYEAIRDSLPDIQYYETVTNLKLETDQEDAQLHVHVREDINEVIQYPTAPLFRHVKCRRLAEEDVEFVAHLSGFVYRVRADGKTVVKKELPGPDTVDEFLYEINALDALRGCDHVIQLEGLVTDNSGQLVKGLLISYAPRGALVDIIYDLRGTSDLPWRRREKWAKQIIQGLSNIHEAGYVQGDFTLSNIVIDDEDNASIIDINRRGCPVGWEPPELGRLIESGQRISMCISTKTDLFQLGMVLWALAQEVDDPERLERPLPTLGGAVPDYYRDAVEICLSERPQGRRSAKELLMLFPRSMSRRQRLAVDVLSDRSSHVPPNRLLPLHRPDKEYIDPQYAMTLDDLDVSQGSYVDATSDYHYGSDGGDSWVMDCGRAPSLFSSKNRKSSPYAGSASSTTSLSAVHKNTGEEAVGGGRPKLRMRSREQPGDSLPIRHVGQFVHTDSGFDEPSHETQF